MQNQFSRTELLIGKDGLNRLSKSKVIIFGLGGVGGYCLEALTRIGIGEIDIVDNDTINLSNLNRQIIALHSTLGQNKVDAARARILDINPNIKTKSCNLFFDEKTKDQFDFKKYDYIIDAIDSVKSKLLLIKCAKENDIKIISSMGTGNKMYPNMLEITDISKTSICPLARKIRYELKKIGIKSLKVLYSKEPPKKIQKEEGVNIISSNSYVPSTAGLMIAGEVINDLLNLNCLKNGE